MFDDPDTIVQQIKAHDRRAVARAISFIENNDDVGHAIVSRLFPDSGRARSIGVTGPPGAGKSSLLSAIVTEMRRSRSDSRIGVVSVDPSSPFTQGALLGDRIRLSEHFLDRNVFIRSMGTRGHLGGLAEATLQVALLLDAAGYDELLLETVGVGQSEIEITDIADTVVLVLMPGAGDAVQALKAGVMEIPDIFVINKADHPEARTLHQQVRAMLQLGKASSRPSPDEDTWQVPIVETEAIRGQGIDKLLEQVEAHRKYLAVGGRLQAQRKTNMEKEVFALASARARLIIEQRVSKAPQLQSLMRQLEDRRIDPLTCVDMIVEEVMVAE